MNTHLNILHLERRKDRLLHLATQLEFNRIEDYTIIHGFEDANTKQAITKGHKLIVSLAKEQGFENCIIAEDDLVFSARGAYDYFLTQLQEMDDYDLFCGLIYHGTVNEENRVLNGMSGTMTLYSIHQRFYDLLLNIPDNVHIDRHLGQFAYEKKYYICNPMVVYQSGSYSDNIKKSMDYSPYLDGKTLFENR